MVDASFNSFRHFGGLQNASKKYVDRFYPINANLLLADLVILDLTHSLIKSK